MSRTNPVTNPNAPAPRTGGGGAGGKAAAPNWEGEIVRARAAEEACEGVGGCCTMGTGPLGLEGGGGGACGTLGRAPPNDVILSPCCWRAAPGDTVRAGSTGRKGERLREFVPGRRNWFSSISSKLSSGAGAEITTILLMG
jgi:hypothetical protein